MTSAASGSEMFDSYSAQCQGKDAKGNGPTATSLRNPPASLTQLARKNNGRFPGNHAANVLRKGQRALMVHADMPVWVPLFSSVSGRDDSITQSERTGRRNNAYGRIGKSPGKLTTSEWKPWLW